MLCKSEVNVLIVDISFKVLLSLLLPAFGTSSVLWAFQHPYCLSHLAHDPHKLSSTLTPAENKGGWKCTVGCERWRPVLGGLSFQCLLYFCIFLKGETRMQKPLAIKYRTYLSLRIVHHFWRPAWRLCVCDFNGRWWAILSSSTVSTNSVWIPGISPVRTGCNLTTTVPFATVILAHSCFLHCQ